MGNFLVNVLQHATDFLYRHKRFIKKSIFVLFLVMVAVVILQLAYPRDRLLPFTKVQHNKIGAVTTAQAKTQVENLYKNSTITVKTEQKEYKEQLSVLGIEIDAHMTATAAADYPLAERFIPFSSVARMIARDIPVSASIDDVRLKYFAQQLQKENDVAPVNAGIEIKDDKVQLVPSKPGKTYGVEDTMKKIHALQLESKNTTLAMGPTVQKAERSDDELKELLEIAQKAIDNSVVLDLEGEKIKVDKAIVTTWIDFPEDPATKKLTLGVKAPEVQAYLAKIQSKIFVAPGTTRVAMVDGKEVSRVNGAPGRGIDNAKTIEMIRASLMVFQAAPVKVPLAVLPPKVVYDRSYSDTQAGLQALLDFLAADKGGYGIALIELGGKGRSANANGGKKFETASTYKLFVAYAVLKQIESGQMQWNQPILNEKTVEACFELMIVKSDNPCAEAFGKKFGWNAIQGMMQALGMSSTTLGNPFLSTALDEALFLQKLEQGSLLSQPSRDKLLDAMHRQIYRAGIPAGAKGTVFDKVGFLNGLLHDAAIVHGAKGTYVLVIMSSGSSWGGIADAARQIDTYLSR